MALASEAEGPVWGQLTGSRLLVWRFYLVQSHSALAGPLAMKHRDLSQSPVTVTEPYTSLACHGMDCLEAQAPTRLPLFLQ